LLKEIALGITAEDMQSVTEAKLIISPDLKEIQLRY
jgi:acyl CoA:acetate/3-ketoacid CoA transferase beta subunit